MTYSLNGGSNDDRVAQLRQQHQAQRTRLFLTFALIEGIAFAVAVVVVFVLELVDPEQGMLILVAIAVIGGGAMSLGLMSMLRRHGQEMRDLTGG